MNFNARFDPCFDRQQTTCQRTNQANQPTTTATQSLLDRIWIPIMTSLLVRRRCCCCTHGVATYWNGHRFEITKVQVYIGREQRPLRKFHRMHGLFKFIRNAAPMTLQGFRSTLLPETITIVLKRRNVPKLTLCRNTIRLRIGRRRIKSITSMMVVNIIRNTHVLIRKLQTNTIPHLQQSLFVSLFSVR